MKTIARNATKKIAAIKAEFTVCRMYDESQGCLLPSKPEYAWKFFELRRPAKLRESTDGTKYTIQWTSNHWFELTRPTA